MGSHAGGNQTGGGRSGEQSPFRCACGDRTLYPDDDEGAIFGLPISFIAVVVILIGGYRLVRAFV